MHFTYRVTARDKSSGEVVTSIPTTQALFDVASMSLGSKNIDTITITPEIHAGLEIYLSVHLALSHYNYTVERLRPKSGTCQRVSEIASKP